MVCVQTQFDLDAIGYSATLPTYRTVLRREHRLGESQDEHLRRCRACAEPRPQVDWSVGHHGDRRAVVVNHDAVANLVGRPGASGMLVPMRFSENGVGPELHGPEPSRPRRPGAGPSELRRSGLRERVQPHRRRRRIERLRLGRWQDLRPRPARRDSRLLLLHHPRGGLAADGKTLTLFPLIPQVSPSPPMCIPSNQA